MTLFWALCLVALSFTEKTTHCEAPCYNLNEHQFQILYNVGFSNRLSSVQQGYDWGRAKNYRPP